MNLIEQLGGYAAAKRYAESRDGADNTSIYDSLQDSLLEYRRQHNIYEVGDKVVHLFYKGSDVQEIKGVNGLKLTLYHYNMGYHYIAYAADFRHATPEEIEAWRRL